MMPQRPGIGRELASGLQGAGLGLRRAFLEELSGLAEASVDFVEVAPENWMKYGGRLGRRFRAVTERFPVLAHGLSLSLGGPTALDLEFLEQLKRFLDLHSIRLYSEHLSFCSDDGQLYDLLPIPFTAEAARYVAERIGRVQDILQRRIAIENISYYAAPGKQIEEIAFIREVLHQADCALLLDVNNVYVNSVNHGYDADAFLQAIPAERIACLHVAGHFRQHRELAIDTHGAPVIEPVWALLAEVYRRHGAFPTVLERDFNIPPLAELLDEVGAIRTLQTTAIERELRYA